MLVAADRTALKTRKEQSRQDDEKSHDERPDLTRTRPDQGRRASATVKVFFGASPGVGKTYAMLARRSSCARRARRRRRCRRNARRAGPRS